MNIVCFDEDEIQELFEFLTQKKKELIRYISERDLSYPEARALLEACEKVEREYKKENEHDI